MIFIAVITGCIKHLRIILCEGFPAVKGSENKAIFVEKASVVYKTVVS